MPQDDTVILFDGLIADEDTIIRNAFTELTPVISVFHGSKTVMLSLRFNDYLFFSSFPLNSTVELVAKGFNSVCFGVCLDRSTSFGIILT